MSEFKKTSTHFEVRRRAFYHSVADIVLTFDTLPEARLKQIEMALETDRTYHKDVTLHEVQGHERLLNSMDGDQAAEKLEEF